MHSNQNPASEPTVHDKFFTPVLQALAAATKKRVCKELPDDEWLKLIIGRVLEQEPSARAYIQQLDDVYGRDLALSTYFDSVGTQRRLDLLREISLAVGCELDASDGAAEKDPFAAIASLNDFDIWAGDGTYLKRATHDPLIDGKAYPTGHFMGLNLRSHRLAALITAEKGGKRKREHDMHAIKRLDAKGLRMGAGVGRKVLWVWDSAAIGSAEWVRLQKQGVYFLSRAKENMKLEAIGDLGFDAEDPLNAGVQSFRLVPVANVALRCVHYRCPITGEDYVFLTTLTTVEPGVIAALYKARWDVEKVFDEVKNKLNEKKSWGTRQVTKDIQAEAIALAHNLMVLLEQHIEQDHGLQPEDDQTRRDARLQKADKQAAERGAALSPLIRQLFIRATQRGVRFVRWLRNKMRATASLVDSLAALRRAWRKIY